MDTDGMATRRASGESRMKVLIFGGYWGHAAPRPHNARPSVVRT